MLVNICQLSDGMPFMRILNIMISSRVAIETVDKNIKTRKNDSSLNFNRIIN